MNKLLSFIIDVLLSYKTYLIMAVFFLLVGHGKKYINILGIIKKYYKKFIFENISTICVLILFPAFLAIAINMKKSIDDDLLELITVAISILMSLFFTYLSFFQDYEEKIIKNTNNYNLKVQKEKYAEETKIVASYEIFLSISILISCFSYSLFNGLILKVCSAIIYFLFFHLLMNLLVLLKRYDSKL